MAAMLKEVYGDDFDTNGFAQRIMEKIEALKLEGKGDIDIGAFRDFTKRFPGLLFPAFKMQLHVQQVVLGNGFWSRLSAKRLKVGTGRAVVNVGQMLEANINVAALNQLVGNVAQQERTNSGKSGIGNTGGKVEFNELYEASGTVAQRREKAGIDIATPGLFKQEIAALDKQLKLPYPAS